MRFPFTKYGTIEGEIVGLSSDSIVDESKGLVFSVRVRLDRSDVMVNGSPVPLTPGMTATVESITGQRRLIEYLLSPLLRYKDESARER
jgi:hemolysin D